jgi:cellobiose-specific phosphotransferase system component IIB
MKVLIVCGAGASSGFIAQRMRKAAKTRGLELQVDARSETELADHLDGTDVVLVGPHLQYMLDKVTAVTEQRGVPAVLLPQRVYGMLDGEAALELAATAAGSSS